MKRADAEKLLGGYAAGILDEAERKLLFEAALEDQALFDALAGEEALRELLSDPAARQQLLAALTKAQKVIPFWRRPMVLGAAASLLVAVGGTLLVNRSEQVAYRPMTPQEQPKASAEPPKDTAATSTAPAKPAPTGTQPQAQLARKDTAPSAPAQNQSAPPSQPAAAGGRERSAEAMADLAPGVAAKAAEEGQAKTKSGRADANQLETKPAEVNAGGPPASAAAPAPARAFAPAPGGELHAKQEVKKEAKRDTSDAAHGAGLGGAAGGVADTSTTLGMSVRMEQASPAPTWKVEVLSPGQFRVKVQWGPAGHLYLLRRGAFGVSALAATSSRPTGGQTETVFIATSAEALDLYLLPEASKAPAALPAEGPIEGFRTRIWPEKK